MRRIPDDLEVLDSPAIHLTPSLALNDQLGKLPRLPLQLYLQRLHMIKVYMRIAHRVRERPRDEITHMRQQMSQQGITRNVERHPKTHITTALIQLTMQVSLGLLPPLLSLLARLRPRKTDIELRKHVTRRQRHDLQIRRVPRAQDDASVIRRLLQLPHDVCELVDALSGVVRIGVYVGRAEVSPLEAVDGAKVALGARRESDAVEVGARAVAVPDLDPGAGEVDGGGGAAYEPEELGEDGAEEHAFGCQEGEDGRTGGGGEGEF